MKKNIIFVQQEHYINNLILGVCSKFIHWQSSRVGHKLKLSFPRADQWRRTAPRRNVSQKPYAFSNSPPKKITPWHCVYIEVTYPSCCEVLLVTQCSWRPTCVIWIDLRRADWSARGRIRICLRQFRKPLKRSHSDSLHSPNYRCKLCYGLRVDIIMLLYRL